jgi:hypothetical protein
LAESYMAIAAFVQQGPAMLKIDLGQGAEASFMVAEVSPPSPLGPGRPFSSFALTGPLGSSLYLDEEQISYVQPEGPQDGTYLHITLDNGTSLVLTRPAQVPQASPRDLLYDSQST